MQHIPEHTLFQLVFLQTMLRSNSAVRKRLRSTVQWPNGDNTRIETWRIRVQAPCWGSCCTEILTMSFTSRCVPMHTMKKIGYRLPKKLLFSKPITSHRLTSLVLPIQNIWKATGPGTQSSALGRPSPQANDAYSPHFSQKLNLFLFSFFFCLINDHQA